MVSFRTAWQLGGTLKTHSGFQWSGNSWLSMPGEIDVSKIGDGSNNSAVEACLTTLANAVAEPPIGVEIDGEIDLEHRATRVLNRPSQWMRGSLLTRHIVVATNVYKHAILWKQRNAIGQVINLVPLPPTVTWPEDGDGALATVEERAEKQAGVGPTITHFEYHPMHTSPRRLEVSEVVYLRQDVDPHDLKAGRSRLHTVLREILSDEEAALFAAALLSNMGIPGVMLVPELEPGEQGPNETEADAIAKKFHQRFSGPRRGRPLMMSGRVKPHRMSFSPEELNFESVRRIPEQRISAVTGVPAILAGLGAGLEAATYSNARELREFFTEQTVVPFWSLLEEEYTFQLLPDYLGQTNTARYAFDTTSVKALQEDEDARWTRYRAALEAGAITVAEFREAVGLEPLPNTDVFLRPISTVETDGIREPETEPVAS